MERGWMMKFAYEDLDVWSKAVDFAVRVIGIVDSIDTSRKHFRLFEQIEASSTSISTNIAGHFLRFLKG
jgi:four helix bundle protein